MSRKNTSLIVVCLLFASTFSYAVTLLSDNAEATTHLVGGGEHGDFPTIKGAIEYANPGDTVYVYSGTYFENVVIDKPLTLIGEDKGTTIVDGSDNEDVILVTADWVNISGFSVTGSGTGWGIPSEIRDAGIIVEADNCSIRDNLVFDNFAGIYLYYDSRFNEVVNNDVYSNGMGGISLYQARYNIIRNNNITGNRNGIMTWGSYYNTFRNNIVSRNPDDGISMTASGINTFDNNDISDNSGHGFELSMANMNVLSNNTIMSNDGSGLSFEEAHWNIVIHNNVSANLNNSVTIVASSHNSISYNMFANNQGRGVQLVDSRDNVVHHNNFISNAGQANDNAPSPFGSNSWDNGYPSGGNYWNDHTRVDAFSGPDQDQPGSDGFSDEAYSIPGRDGIDRYPLMNLVDLPPSAPLELSAIPGDGAVMLKWDPPKSDGGSLIQKYKVHRGTEPGEETLLTEITGAQSYEDEGLINLQRYYYRISAVNQWGEGPTSESVEVMPEPGVEEDPDWAWTLLLPVIILVVVAVSILYVFSKRKKSE